jgi:hypothetical protein
MMRVVNSPNRMSFYWYSFSFYFYEPLLGDDQPLLLECWTPILHPVYLYSKVQSKNDSSLLIQHSMNGITKPTLGLKLQWHLHSTWFSLTTNCRYICGLELLRNYCTLSTTWRSIYLIVCFCGVLNGFECADIVVWLGSLVHSSCRSTAVGK